MGRFAVDSCPATCFLGKALSPAHSLPFLGSSLIIIMRSSGEKGNVFGSNWLPRFSPPPFNMLILMLRLPKDKECCYVVTFGSPTKHLKSKPLEDTQFGLIIIKHDTTVKFPTQTNDTHNSIISTTTKQQSLSDNSPLLNGLTCPLLLHVHQR